MIAKAFSILQIMFNASIIYQSEMVLIQFRFLIHYDSESLSGHHQAFSIPRKAQKALGFGGTELPEGKYIGRIYFQFYAHINTQTHT